MAHFAVVHNTEISVYIKHSCIDDDGNLSLFTDFGS